ncbi:MAG: DNA polymerase III subunit beta [Candidatus Protochlamydia sp.]|nr:DNA polymerase III subunit beta [Candidatus Protochlamydia sp.]
MKFVISTQELNYLIGKIQNIVPPKPTVPILSNFLIEAFNDELILTATDLTVGIRCHTEAKILEEGAIVLPAKRLAQLARELTVANLEISTNSNEVTTLIAGTSRFKLNGINKNDYPPLLDLSDASHFQIEQSKLKDLLYRTSFAVSKEDNRYALTGVLMQINQRRVSFVGTDGKRLARAHSSVDLPFDFTSHSIIPLKTVDEILKTLGEEGMAKISILPDKLALEANQTLLLTKLLSGDYPDINRVIPEKSDIVVTLHREELTSLLRQISLFTSDDNRSVRFIFSDGELHLIANNADFGEGNVSMPVNYQGVKLEIAFNPTFFLDILRHCKEETVTIGLTDAYNPGIITDGGELHESLEVSPLFIIMPLRLSED